MDLSLALTIIGLILTLVFGFLSIDLFKRKKYPGRITFVKRTNISLFNSIVKNFNEIKVQYDNNPVDENLIYVKGCFINDGDIDIEGNKIEKPISLSLPEGLSWINCKITDKTKDFNPGFNITSKNNIDFTFGLFRRNEYFQIEAIVEANHDKTNHENIFEEIKFDHRISNTQKISVENLLSENQMKNKKGKIKSNLISTAVQLLLPTLLSIILIAFYKSADIRYKTISNGTTLIYKAQAKNNGLIELTELSSDKEIFITINEFQNKQKYIPFIPEITIWQRLKSSWYILPLYVILVLLFVGFDYYEVRKSNKIYKILKPDSKTD